MTEPSVVEVRALKALYRNHPSTPPNLRYGVAARWHALASRDMLLEWAATKSDAELLWCRNFGVASLAWVRSQTGAAPGPCSEAVAAERAHIAAAVMALDGQDHDGEACDQCINRAAVLALLGVEP